MLFHGNHYIHFIFWDQKSAYQFQLQVWRSPSQEDATPLPAPEKDIILFTIHI